MPINVDHFLEAVKAFQRALGYDLLASQYGRNWGAAPATLLNDVRKKRASAIRGERHVRPIYDYCRREFIGAGFKTDYLFPREGTTTRSRTNVHGGFFEKEVDAGLSLEHTGPLLIVSVKAMLTASRNLKNRIEEAIADATNLHTRYPMLCFGMLVIVPYRMETEKGATDRTSGQSVKKRKWSDEVLMRQDETPTALADNFLRYVSQLQPRVAITETPARYEAVALAVVDFDHNPPRLNLDFPPSDSSVRIEPFFDVLKQRFMDRNRFISEVFEQRGHEV